MQTELSPGYRLTEFFKRAEPAWKRNERVRQLCHEGFAFVHGLDDVQVGETQVCNLAVRKRSREDPDDFSPFGQHGVCEYSHQAYARSAVDETNAAIGKLASKRNGRCTVDIVGPGTRAAKHTNPAQRHGRTIIRPFFSGGRILKPSRSELRLRNMTRAEVERAFTAHKDAVYRFAWRMAPGAADDIAQEVFLRLLRGQAQFDEARGSLRGFLLGIARNLALQHLKANARWELIDEEQFVATPFPVDGFDIGELVGRAVRALPPLQRDVFILAEYEELSLEEIARTVDTNVGAVKSRLHRARENLRRMLAPLRSDSARVAAGLKE